MISIEPTPEFEHDLAVSYAGEDRTTVAEIVRQLGDYRVFYDQDRLAEMWGENGVDFLEAIYTRKARFAVIFVSQHYVSKKWPTLERRAAQARAMEQDSPYILPVKIDDTELPGMPATTIYLDIRQVGVEGVVAALHSKLGAMTAAPPISPNYRVPRTPDAISRLLADRPPGWPYLLYGATLVQGFESLEERYRDHEIRYADRGPTYYNDEAASDKLQGSMATVRAITDSLDRVLSAEAQIVAMGSPSDDGDESTRQPDADRTIHLARRFVSVYRELLDWAADLRAMNIYDEHLRRAAEVQAQFADQPIRAMRDFVANYVSQADTFVGRLLDGENIRVQWVVTFTLPEELTDARNQHIKAWRES